MPQLLSTVVYHLYITILRIVIYTTSLNGGWTDGCSQYIKDRLASSLDHDNVVGKYGWEASPVIT